jgi:mono/diheme cytochrome c family protein
MKKEYLVRTLWSVVLVGLLWSTASPVAEGQYTQNRKDTIMVDPAGFPVDIHAGYELFRQKCSECHGLDVALRSSLSAPQWSSEVNRMRAMAGSQISDDQAVAIVNFLNYDEIHRKLMLKPVMVPQTGVTAAPVDSIEAGHRFFLAQGCDACHSIGGKGGAIKSLDGVGARLSRQQLISRVKAPSAGSIMPALPANIPDAQVENLIAFLLSLKGR